MISMHITQEYNAPIPAAKNILRRDALKSSPLISPDPLALGPATPHLDLTTVPANIEMCLKMVCRALCVSQAKPYATIPTSSIIKA